MGKSYYVPRSAKGESRLLYIFTMKSFLTTLLFAGIGFGFALLINVVHELSIFSKIFIVLPFAVIGFGIGALTIPDSPIMGPLRKAGGEKVLDILIRLIKFPSNKKIYIYGKDRKVDFNKKDNNSKSTFTSLLKK